MSSFTPDCHKLNNKLFLKNEKNGLKGSTITLPSYRSFENYAQICNGKAN